MASSHITSWQTEGGKVETVIDFIFLGSKITADGDWSFEIKRCLLLGRKAITNRDSILKSRHHFVDKSVYSQSYGFSSSHVWMWELDYKESWAQKNFCFWSVVLEKTFSAGVQPLWIQGDSKVGMESASLEKYIFNYKYIERLETDSVVGKLLEKKRLNIHPEKRGARKKRHGGISLSRNWSNFFVLGFAYIPFVTHRDEYRVTRGSAVLTFIKIRCFT